MASLGSLTLDVAGVGQIKRLGFDLDSTKRHVGRMQDLAYYAAGVQLRLLD